MRRDYVYGYPTKDESSVRCFVAVSCGSGCDHPHPKVAFHSDLMYCMDCHKWFLPVYASDIEFFHWEPCSVLRARYKLAHRPTFHHFSREEQAAYERNYYLLHPEKRKRKRETV